MGKYEPGSIGPGNSRPVLHEAEEYLDRIRGDAQFLIKQSDKIKTELEKIIVETQSIKKLYESDPWAAHKKVGTLLEEIAGLGGIVSHTRDVITKMHADAREILARGV
jgi:sugar-specific transcriptional regulator TrmB